MGYKLLPTNEKISLLESLGVDEWGVRKSIQVSKMLDCIIKSVEVSTPLTDLGGKQVYPTFEISFNGAVGLSVGDRIEVTGTAYTVLEKKEYKDFGRSVIYTKVRA